MDQKQKTRRREQAPAGSPKTFSGGKIVEDTAYPTSLQAAWLASRYAIGAAHARVLAEAHFGGVHSRGGR